MKESLKERVKGRPISAKPDELVIDASNFDQYFHDARTHKPEVGQVMAKYSAVAYLEDGQLKRDLIGLLHRQDKAESATRVMQVLGGATHKDSIRVPMEMVNDLLSGMSDDQVAKKPYRYMYEQIFWAEKGVVPENDPHWYKIPILNWARQFDEQCDRLGLDDEFLPAKFEIRENFPPEARSTGHEDLSKNPDVVQ